MVSLLRTGNVLLDVFMDEVLRVSLMFCYDGIEDALD
jgi:hypothetical protein